MRTYKERNEYMNKYEQKKKLLFKTEKQQR